MTRNIKRMRRISLISVFYLCNLLHKYNAMVLLSLQYIVYLRLQKELWSTFQPHIAQPLPKQPQPGIPEVCPAHNTFQEISNISEIFHNILGTYRNAVLKFYEKSRSLCFAKQNIHWKLLKQALNSFIAPSTGLIKSWEFLYTLII